MKLPFLTPHFFWLKLVLLLLISLCANKKGGSIKVVSWRFDVTTDELWIFLHLKCFLICPASFTLIMIAVQKTLHICRTTYTMDAWHLCTANREAIWSGTMTSFKGIWCIALACTCKISIKTIVSPANALFAGTPTVLLQTLFVYAIGLSAAICSCRLSRPGSMCGTAGQGLLEAVCDDVGSRLKQGRCVAPDKEI